MLFEAEMQLRNAADQSRDGQLKQLSEGNPKEREVRNIAVLYASGLIDP